jgi:hypothetical protein
LEGVDIGKRPGVAAINLSRLDRSGYASVIFVQRRLIEAFATI